MSADRSRNSSRKGIQEMSIIGRVRIYKNGETIVPGVDMGAHIEVIKLTRSSLVIKVPAHTYWAGIGMRGNAKGTFHVLKILGINGEGDNWTEYHVEEVTDFPVRGIDDSLVKSMERIGKKAEDEATMKQREINREIDSLR